MLVEMETDWGVCPIECQVKMEGGESVHSLAVLLVCTMMLFLLADMCVGILAVRIASEQKKQ